MRVNKKSLEQFLANAKKAIDNSICDPLIVKLVESRGYSIEELQRGRKLYELAYESFIEQKEEKEKELERVRSYRKSFEAARKKYLKIYSQARKAFRDDSFRSYSLGLIGERESAPQKWVLQAGLLYKNALKDRLILQELRKQEISRAQLLSGCSLLEQLERVSLYREKRADRDSRIKLLARWYLKYNKTARLILSDNPALLGKLGLNDCKLK